MKRRWVVFAAVTVLTVSAFAADLPDTVFPAVAPGMTVDAVRVLIPDLKEHGGAPEGAAGFDAPDTAVAKGIKLLFVGGQVALLTYQFDAAGATKVFAAAKAAYGDPKEGDGKTAGLYAVGESSLQIAADEEDDGAGSVTFVNPKAMKSLSQ
ncbi:MAG: hypothetical protein M5R36_12750 [Deltaproteobacteria bacterium]|nr:hypothetical protein [Deltaproteobacteria bacterium]